MWYLEALTGNNKYYALKFQFIFHIASMWGHIEVITAITIKDVHEDRGKDNVYKNTNTRRGMDY